MTTTPVTVRPGMRIKVVQHIERREGSWSSEVAGTVVSAEPQPTGAWYAHAKDDHYWLVRVELLKADGEVTSLVLDRNTQITVLDS